MDDFIRRFNSNVTLDDMTDIIAKTTDRHHSELSSETPGIRLIPSASETSSHSVMQDPIALRKNIAQLIQEACQKDHWSIHKSDCKNGMRSNDWQPAWAKEGRSPSFISNESLEEEEARRSMQSRGISLWGNTPATDILNLSCNENDLEKDFSLAFIASGDLRHVVHTINSLPVHYTGSSKIFVNDGTMHVVCRNLVLLLIIGNISDEVLAADMALHFWYSTFMPSEYRLQISLLLGKFLEEWLSAEGGATISLGPTSKMFVCLSDGAKKYFLHFISQAFTVGDIQEAYDQARLLPSRRDNRDRMYAGLRPSHRVAFQEFRRFGIVLPFGAANAHFNVPNVSLFSFDGKWLQTDYADPLEGWNIRSVIEAGRTCGAQVEDIYGCLYFYLSAQLQQFTRRLRTFNLSFTMTSFDARAVPAGIHKGVFAKYNLPPSVRFDRIEVSNILDANYVGLDGVLTNWGPLLAEGRDAAVVGYFMNWMTQQQDGRGSRAGEAVMSRLISAYLKKDMDGVPKKMTNVLDIQNLVFGGLLAIEALYENSKPFAMFLRKQGLHATLRKTKLRMREKHRIVPHRLLVPLHAAADALPEFPDKDAWYYHTKLTNFTCHPDEPITYIKNQCTHALTCLTSRRYSIRVSHRMDDFIKRFNSQMTTDEMESVMAHARDQEIRQYQPSQGVGIRVQPPDPRNASHLSAAAHDPNFFRANMAQVVQEATTPKFTPPARLPCANVQAEKYTACGNPGTSACSACKLVSYCSKACQKAHWATHKKDCRNKMRSVDWKPIWIREGRQPMFIANETLEEESARRFSEGWSLGVSLWGNMPAIDVLNLPLNENDFKKDYHLAFIGVYIYHPKYITHNNTHLYLPASGDLRHVVHTINALPLDYSGRLNIFINDGTLHVACRNLVVLLILGNIPDQATAADMALHFWYSAFLPFEYRVQILLLLTQFLEGHTSNLGVEATVPLGPKAKMAVCFPQPAAEVLLQFASSPLSVGDVQKEYERVRNVPSRADYRDRMYSQLRPSHRVAFQEYRRFGIVLPFGAANAHFNVPNLSLFSPNGRWMQNDYADPLKGWDTKAVIEAGKAHGAHVEDIYGCLYFFLSSEFRQFAERLRTFNISFSMSSFDARDIPQMILKGVLAAPLTMPPSIKFDRIEVSNILDGNYVGIDGVLSQWGAFLKGGKDASVLGYFMNWIAQEEEGRASTAGGGDGAVGEGLVMAAVQKTMESDGIIGRPKREDMQRLLFAAMSDSEALYENSKPFAAYLKKQGLDAVLRKTKLRLRQKHRIVPHRLLAPLGAVANALPVFPDKDAWYYDVSFLCFCSYVTWELMADLYDTDKVDVLYVVREVCGIRESVNERGAEGCRVAQMYSEVRNIIGTRAGTNIKQMDLSALPVRGI
ncbi:hypothetical protein CVT26_007458 [Gymnopilus dilepis]|uniref:MYND-type domain-containing protein n=1 Tax=Gymnopilus dilepis TaxID=231916 RepID=A0A409WLB1_9AGAR|nr:hypothetical protein CVT26_007458 [Gymnopilus dilepis]